MNEEKIKENLAKVKKIKENKLLKEFKEFILRGNVMDMAVGVIIGGAFSGIVSALTDDVINPLINGIGGAEVAGKLAIYGGQYIDYGHLLTAIINFLIMAFVLFMLLKSVNKLMNLGHKKEEEAPAAPAEPVKSNEELLLEEIRDLLKNK